MSGFPWKPHASPPQQPLVHGSLGLPASQCRRPAAVASRSRSIYVLATASSERDGGQREGTTQRMRPVSAPSAAAAARVARLINARRRRAGAREQVGSFILFGCHANHRWDIWVACDMRGMRARRVAQASQIRASALTKPVFRASGSKTLASRAKLSALCCACTCAEALRTHF